MKMTVASEFMHRLMLIAALSMTGCTPVGPDYVAPTVTTPAVWNAKLEAGLAGTDPGVEALARWWSKLQEPVLLELIDRAVISNRDLQQAQARVREARARGGISAAERFPTVNVGGAATRNQTSDESGFGTTRELYSVGVDARWEIDLFGGKRRALEAASASIEASEDDLRDVLVSLIGDVALSYVDLRTFQTRWSIAASNLAAQSETFDIARWRYEAGLTTARDVEQARLNLEQTRAQMPTLRTGIEHAGHRIAILLGQNPGTLNNEWVRSKAIPMIATEVTVGVPADALRRRPDVRRAERQLAAQTAQIGVATAALYPSFSLVGSIGLEALTPGRLITASARTTAIGGNADWPLFDAGRIRQNIAVQTALQEQALGRYEATILTALREVEAAVDAAQAKVLQTLATIDEAQNQLARLQRVRELSGGKVPSPQDLGAAEATLKRAEADAANARAAVAQAQASLDANETDLSKAVIRAPVNGVVLKRAAQPGQTVAASFQAPVLFTLAEDLTKMELHVNVDEADVGEVKKGQEATFTVDAYPERTYPARIREVRFAAQTLQGVVTYETVLNASNADLSLRPGMTATADIIIKRIERALLVPNAALRFTPPAPEQEAAPGGSLLSKLFPRPPRTGARGSKGSDPTHKKQQRVWTLHDGEPVAIAIATGATNGVLTEVVSGAVEPGMALLVDTIALRK